MRKQIKYGSLTLILLMALRTATGQNVYTINADSVKLTGCDSSELIIENHTQNVPGFLFNTGKGRTIFKQGVQKLNDSLYLIGADTLKVRTNSWVQGGNTFGTTGILGTLDNNHLDLYTNNAGRLRLTNTGNLLLGTTDDGGYKLQINGKTFSTGSISIQNDGSFLGTENGLMIKANSSSSYAAANFYNDQSNVGQIFCTGSTYAGFSSIVQQNFGFYTNSPGGIVMVAEDSALPVIRFSTGNYGSATEKMRLSAGNLLIGTTVDNGNTLNVSGSGYFDGAETVTGAVRFSGLTSDTSKTRVLVSDADGNLYYRDASTLAANDMIRSSLAVNGPITAQKLHLTAHDWPDYVFDSLYHLLPLPDLEGYIRHNHHLPGLASAAEIQKGGVEVGETQAVLLRKIEELTLYSIEQDKKLALLQSKVEELTRLINSKK